jgi:CheY-like chemotaxis protein
MSDDLVSLRMLLIGATQPDQEIWRQAARLASVPIEFATSDARSIVGALAQGGADICVLEGELSDVDKTKVIMAVNAVRPVPLVFVSSPKGNIRFDGVDGMLTKPASINDARVLTEICVRKKFPTRVLIVDDSGTMRSIVRKILLAGRFAMDIHEASEGRAALEQLRGGNFGIVFLDCNMPGLNGFETLAQIKSDSPNLAVVMMSSTLENGIADRARAAGALAYLKKPFYPADIDATLERFYGLHTPP